MAQINTNWPWINILFTLSCAIFVGNKHEKLYSKCVGKSGVWCSIIWGMFINSLPVKFEKSGNISIKTRLLHPWNFIGNIFCLASLLCDSWSYDFQKVNLSQIIEYQTRDFSPSLLYIVLRLPLNEGAVRNRENVYSWSDFAPFFIPPME